MSWMTHANAFCRDLGLCDMTIGGEYWGANNADPAKLTEVSAYLADHRHALDTMGKGMLIAFVAASASVLLWKRTLTAEEENAVISAMDTARESQELGSYVWYFVDEPGSDDPFTAWLAMKFPGWHPQHWP